MFGPRLRDEEVLRIAIDGRVGGSFSFLVRRQGQELDHVGTYREIDRPRRLVFTWGIAGSSADESVVIIEITPLETGSELTLTHEMDPKWAEYASRTEAGWTTMLNALAARSIKAREATPQALTRRNGCFTPLARGWHDVRSPLAATLRRSSDRAVCGTKREVPGPPGRP